jgi:SAM-dependent methyltransferase
VNQDLIENTKLFEEWAQTEGYPYFRTDEYDAVLRRASRLRTGSQRILDIGSGVGMVAAQLKRQGHHVTGLDLSESALSVALREKRIDAAIAGDVCAAQIPAQSFDVVLCWGVLMLIFDLRPVFERIRHILKDDGQVLFFDHHARNPYTRAHFSRPDWVDRILEGHSNVARHAFTEADILDVSAGLFRWGAPEFHSMFTAHPHPLINAAHIGARGFFQTARAVTRAPWTGNFISMVGTKA